MKLQLFKVANGGLYNEENPLEVDFGKSKKVSLSGDSGSGKTTALECFKLILGAIDADKKVIEALLNKDSGKLEVEQTFVGKDRKTYSIKLTKSQFLDEIWLADGDKTPSLFADYLEKHFFVSVYYGWLVGMFKANWKKRVEEILKTKSLEL